MPDSEFALLMWHVGFASCWMGLWWLWVRRQQQRQQSALQHKREALCLRQKTLAEKTRHHERLVEDVVQAMQQPARLMWQLHADLKTRHDVSPEVSHYLTQVFQAVAHLNTILNDLVEPVHNRAQDTSALWRMHMTACDVRAVVQEVGDMFALRCDLLGLAYACEMGSNVPEQWRTDAGRLKQVLINLLNNAVKFTPQGRIVLRVSADAQHIKFEVQDTGIGIAPHQQALLFQRFSQAHQDNRAHYGGHGLGLAISRQLVSQLGGQMGVVSVMGQGACFWFSLPLNPPISAD